MGVPLVEIAHDADHQSIRGPDCEPNAAHAPAGNQMSAHAFEALVERSFPVQVQIETGEQRREAIGVFNLGFRSAPEVELQAVFQGILGESCYVKPLGMSLLHREQGAVEPHPGLRGLRKIGSNLPAFSFTVRAKHAEWITMVAADNRFHFLRSHRTLLWQEPRNKAELRATIA